MFFTLKRLWFDKETGAGYVMYHESHRQIVILPYGSKCPVCGDKTLDHTYAQIRNLEGKDGYRTLLVNHECQYAIWTKWQGGIPF